MADDKSQADLHSAQLWYNDRFNVAGYTYPNDLLSNQAAYGGNWVFFRINVHEDSYLAKQNGGANLAPPEATAGLPPSKRGEVAGLNAAAISAIPTVAAGAAAASTGAAQKVAGMTGTSLSGTGAAVGNAGLGIAMGAATASSIGANLKKEYKTMKVGICLYLPGDLSVKYGATWAETDLDTTTAMVQGASEAAAAALKVGAGAALGKVADKFLGKYTKGYGSKVGAAIGGAMALNNLGAMGDIATAQGLKTPGAGEMVSKASGTAANPKKEQLFKNVDFRTFTFSYQFFPRSEQEAAAVQNIIKQFKLHMHPEFRDSNNFLYIYPSEFDVVYYNGGKENMNLHRHTSCVLTDLNISYAPQGHFTSFANGMPTQINLTLTFKELALLTKKDIEDGY